VAHFEIPLDLPHAGRIADRLSALVERHVEEFQLDAEEAVRAAHRLPDGEPLEQDPHDIAAPLPVETVRDDRGRRRRRAA